ncbi:hypothetical protein XENORESO_014027 [Xenotaenia resolanae]|uniref:Uncharacterized protein n=1 Tax=Xenotaenia resolanae TaxID=208358 RepID=A0ABV0X4G2_9TELE
MKNMFQKCRTLTVWRNQIPLHMLLIFDLQPWDTCRTYYTFSIICAFNHGEPCKAYFFSSLCQTLQTADPRGQFQTLLTRGHTPLITGLRNSLHTRSQNGSVTLRSIYDS